MFRQGWLSPGGYLLLSCFTMLTAVFMVSRRNAEAQFYGSSIDSDLSRFRHDTRSCSRRRHIRWIALLLNAEVCMITRLFVPLSVGTIDLSYHGPFLWNTNVVWFSS